MAKWNYVDATCQCGKSRRIRIDQFRRSGEVWKCLSCSRKGRPSHRKGSGIKNDDTRYGSYKSYNRAKRRCRINHKGAYEAIEFRFASFDEWFAELGPRPEGMSVDRINPRGHYEPGNVRWATIAEQCRNRNNNVIVEYNGTLMCMTDAAKASGIPYGTLEKRIRAGCPQSHLFLKKKWRYKNGKLADID